MGEGTGEGIWGWIWGLRLDRRGLVSAWRGLLGGDMWFGLEGRWVRSELLGGLVCSFVATAGFFGRGAKSEIVFSSGVMDLCPSFALRSGVRSCWGRSQLRILGDRAAGLTSTVEYLDGEEIDNESSEEIGIPDDEALWRLILELRLL